MPYPYVQMNTPVYSDTRLKDVDLRVLGVMIAEAGEKRTFRRFRRWVAERVSKSEHVVADSWRRLEQAGYIRRLLKGQKFGDGPGNPPTFSIEPAASPEVKTVKKTARQEPLAV